MLNAIIHPSNIVPSLKVPFHRLAFSGYRKSYDVSLDSSQCQLFNYDATQNGKNKQIKAQDNGIGHTKIMDHEW
jgi:hypothetical protein